MPKLELFSPYKPLNVFQKFGENDACFQGPLKKPTVVGKVNGVCPPGFQELYPQLGMKGHTGLDLSAPDGVALRAPHDGIVCEIYTEVERGLGVEIVTADRRDMGPHGIHYAKTRQWHLKAILVKKGQVVKVGHIIGLADSTGLSSGSHDHFELKPVEYDQQGNLYNVYQDNGYFGAIDPLPFLSKRITAEDYKRARERISLIQRLLEKIKLWSLQR